MSLFSVKAPKEDPAVAAARQQQQAQADQQFTTDTQTDLMRRTRQRLALYGFGGSAAPPLAPAARVPRGIDITGMSALQIMQAR